jgi:hypothetical protein
MCTTSTTAYVLNTSRVGAGTPYGGGVLNYPARRAGSCCDHEVDVDEREPPEGCRVLCHRRQRACILDVPLREVIGSEAPVRYFLEQLQPTLVVGHGTRTRASGHCTERRRAALRPPPDPQLSLT